MIHTFTFVIQYFFYVIPFLLYIQSQKHEQKKVWWNEQKKKEKWQIELVTLKHFIPEVKHSKGKLIEF